MAEAVSIVLQRPTLNVQDEFDFVLPSCRSRPNLQAFAADRPDATTPPVATPPTAAAAPPNAGGGEGGELAPRAAQERVRTLRPLPHRV